MPRALRITTFAVMTSLSFTSVGRGESKCRIRIHGDEAGWHDAIRAIEHRVETDPGDCAAIDIRLTNSGAAIELHTVDGRSAERRVETPAEAEPLVRAMLIGFDAPTAPEPDVAPLPIPESPPASEPAAAAAAIPDADLRVKPGSDKAHLEVFGGVQAGMQLQAHDDASGVGEAIFGVSWRGWDVASFAKWEFEHHQDSDLANSAARGRHSNLDAAGGGTMLGRRQAIGPVTLVFGASFGLYSVDQESGGHRAETPHVEGSVIDPRGGFYFGALFPAAGRIRTRAQLDGEMAFASHSAGSEFPDVPQWGIGLKVGVDLGLIP